MISKRYTHVLRKPAPTVVRCLDVGAMEARGRDFADLPGKIIVLGCIDKNLYVLDGGGETVQVIPFDGWVRSCRAVDITGDGISEIVVGSGDKTLRVFKYNPDSREFEEMYCREFGNNVNGVDAGNLKGDGSTQIVGGGWDNTVRAFEGTSGDLLWEVELDGWVSTAKTGDVTWDGRDEVMVGLKTGEFLVLDGPSGKTLWSHQFEKEVLTCAVGDLDNTGTNHVVVGGADENLYFFSGGGALEHEVKLGTRVIEVAVGDIDGDNAVEIVACCGDNRVRVFENKTRALAGIQLRWRATFEKNVHGCWVGDLNASGSNEIVTAGYDKTVRALRDFAYGSKPKMEVTPLPHFEPKETIPAAGGPPLVEVGGKRLPWPYNFPYLEKVNRIDDLLYADLRAFKPNVEALVGAPAARDLVSGMAAGGEHDWAPIEKIGDLMRKVGDI
ncbi:MAG: WD40 repeat domain-containing protein [Promethearchaeota archaeon]